MKKGKKEKQSGTCSYPGCRKIVDEGGYCFGCHQFICDRHCTNLLVMGFGHPVALHWSEEKT